MKPASLACLLSALFLAWPHPARSATSGSSQRAGTGSILIDRSHGGNDFVNGFTDDLASQGWVIAEHPSGGGPVTASVLAGYDILMVTISWIPDAPMTAWTSEEVEAVRTFLYSGGGALWMLHHNRNPFSANSLAQAFGVNFKYDLVRDPTNNEGSDTHPTIHVLEQHPIFEGVSSYGYYGGDCVTAVAPVFIKARGDDDAYSLNCPVGTRPGTLAVMDFNGRAVFSGNNSPLSPARHATLRPEERLLLHNIANWLIQDATTAASPTTWGSVKAGYADEGAR